MGCLLWYREKCGFGLLTRNQGARDVRNREQWKLEVQQEAFWCFGTIGC